MIPEYCRLRSSTLLSTIKLLMGDNTPTFKERTELIQLLLDADALPESEDQIRQAFQKWYWETEPCCSTEQQLVLRSWQAAFEYMNKEIFKILPKEEG